MEKINCIISLGSNTHAKENLQKARDLLVRTYPSILFGEEKETRAIGMEHNTAPFLNQVAKFTTEQEAEEVHTALKIIERFCGRRPSDKENETIPIDIDLLAYGDTILKPMDFARYTNEISALDA